MIDFQSRGCLHAHNMWFHYTPLMHHYCTGEMFTHGINQVNEFMGSGPTSLKTH